MPNPGHGVLLVSWSVSCQRSVMGPVRWGIWFGTVIWISEISRLPAQESKEGDPRITAVRNQVQTTGGGTNRVADVGDPVHAGEAVKTGNQGLAELKGQGDTTVRIGEKTRAAFDPTNRQVKVDQGTVLIHAPAKEGPMKVEAGGVTITVEESPTTDLTEEKNKK